MTTPHAALLPDDLLSDDERGLALRARDAARKLERSVEPGGGDIAEEDAAAREALEAVTEAGLLQTIVSAPATGAPVAVRDVCVVREELARASGLADAMYVMQGLGSAAIALEGSADLRSRYLPGVLRGETIAAIGLTEPEAGSDLGGITTRARRDGDRYVLDGVKTYISNAGLANLYTVLARTSGEGREGLTAFAVDASTPGLSVERIAVTAPHPIGRVTLDGCRVSAENRVGQEGTGFDLALRVLGRFRPTVGAAANGLARAALESSLERAGVRRQFGRPIGSFQAIRFKLADMATSLAASRLLVLRAAGAIDRAGPDASRLDLSAKAKLYATESAQRIVDDAVQIHGALGVTRGHKIERLYREVRALRIYEGTSEIQRAIIARSLLGDRR